MVSYVWLRRRVRPASLQWEASWGVFVVTAIMLEVASPETLRCFGAHVQRFRQHVWFFCAGCCQAEVRMRSEEFEPLRLTGERELAALTAFVAPPAAAPPPCPVTSLSADRPWKWEVERTESRATLVRTHMCHSAKCWVKHPVSSLKPETTPRRLTRMQDSSSCGQRWRRRAHACTTASVAAEASKWELEKVVDGGYTTSRRGLWSLARRIRVARCKTITYRVSGIGCSAQSSPQSHV